MISIKGLIFIGLFFLCAVGALFAPQLGIYGYVADYCIGPSGQWWEAPFSSLGLRYSFTLALATLVGMLMHWRNLGFGDHFLLTQEKILLMFLATVWFSSLIAPDTVGRYTTVDHPTMKFTKVAVFVLMTTHVITDRRKIRGLFWVFVLAALLLGLKAWDTPWRAFQSGRLEGVGGADFAEANFLAAFMAAMLPIIGIQFLQSGWKGKVLCALSGAFTANAVVLCRSRGAFVGIAAGVIAAGLFAPKRHRKKIAVCLVLGILGGIYVTDERFIERITTITKSGEERDESAASRFRLWSAGGRMLLDHPLGIGIGNWYQTIGRYIPEYEGKDSHSTYVKCAAELGFLGSLLFAWMILASFFRLRRISQQAQSLPEEMGDPIIQYSFAITVSLAILLTCGLTISMTYMEGLWILLMLPVCLARVLDSTALQAEPAPSGKYTVDETVRPQPAEG